MIDDTPGIAGTKWFLISLAVVLMLLGAGVRTYGIKDPWVQGHIGWSGYRSGTIARNYVRFGYADTRLGAVRNTGPVHPDKFTYDEHPPVIYWLTSISYRIWGVHEWSATLVPILCSAISVGLLFLLAFRLWGLAPAILAAAFMILVPMDAYYGRMVDHEAPTLLFSLLTFYLYVLWTEKRSRGYLIGIFVAFALAGLSDFPGYFVAPWLALYHFISETRKGVRWKFSLGLLLAGLLLFVAWALYLRWISGSFEILTSRFAIRRSGWPPWVFTAGELYRLEFLRLQGLYTPTLGWLALLWAAFMAWDVHLKRNLARHGFVAMLGGFGITYLVLFQQNAYQHDFVAYYLTPFFCIASAWAVVLFAEKFLYPRWQLLVAALALVVFVTFFGEATASLRELYLPREAGYVKVAQYLNSKLPVESKVMASIEDSTRNQWIFYLDRPSLDVTDLPTLEMKVVDPSYGYFVLDTRLAGTTQELRDYLMRHYAAETMDAFLIFDLHQPTPNLVSDRLAGDVQPLSGEPYHDSHLTLLGYQMPGEIRWSQPSPWYSYLYSARAYWPVGNDLSLRATVYWRCDQPAAAGYVPEVTLRSPYDRTYAIEPRYAPQMTAYPASNWRQGDVVRTDYFFHIPQGHPSTRYALSVSWPGEAGEAQGKDNKIWTSVASVSVLPLSLPQPLPEAPRPRYPLVDTPAAGLKFLGYDLDREKVPPGSVIRLSAYWQALDGLEGDYAVLARLQSGDCTLTEPLQMSPTRLWEKGKFYRADLWLAPPGDLLAGRYSLSLVMRGPAKGTIPLTTLEVTSDHQVGIVRRWGNADGSGQDMKPLSPEQPLRLTFDLRKQRDLDIVVAWTGRAELDQTRVEVYVVNDQWHAPRKYLTTWVVGQGMLRTSWQRIPSFLTSEGLNTLELRVPSVPGESHALGWRGLLDSIVPNILQDPGARESGTLEVDFIQVSSAYPSDDWEEFYQLASVYAERNMWDEVRQVYRNARERGASPTASEDLGLFLQAAGKAGDADLKAQLEGRLAGQTPHKTSIVLGDQMEFIGYEATRVAKERVRLNFFFRALEAIPADYTLWAHATPSDPNLLYGRARQAGYLTLDHGLKTSAWQPGGIYRDSYDALLLPGNYDLILGVWRWEDGTRLWRKDDPASHTIDLGRVSLP